MSRFTFILNPRAGKGSGAKLRDGILQAIKIRTSDFDFVESSKPGDAVELARNSSSPIVVAVGGDGTIHEVANGIVGSGKILGVIPVGSGNDFVKSINVPRDLEASVACLLRATISLIDVGRVETVCDGQGNSSASFFVNGLGAGFDAAVAEQARRIPFFSGTLLYLIAVFRTFGRYTSPDFTVSVDGRTTESKNLLIAIGNGVCAGGGFYLTPDSRLSDGLLDVCLIDELSIPGVLAIMPVVMKGSHRDKPHVRFERGKSIHITTSAGVCVHADGEILGSDIRMVHIEVVPKALSVITG